MREIFRMPHIIEFQPPVGVETERRMFVRNSLRDARIDLARELNLPSLPPPVSQSPETYKVGSAVWTITAAAMPPCSR